MLLGGILFLLKGLEGKLKWNTNYVIYKTTITSGQTFRGPKVRPYPGE